MLDPTEEDRQRLRIMKRFIGLLWIIVIFPLSLSAQSEQWLSPIGYSVKISYRALQPGEILVFTTNSTSVKEAQVWFMDRKIAMGKDKTSPKFRAFLGLDLGIKPGVYPVKILFQDSSGRWDTLEKEITVLSKDFPVKKLWVDEKYVTPPPSVRERIQQESEILRTIYDRFTSGWLGKGQFILPLEGKSSDNFGERRIYNNKPRTSHGGVDISAPAGTPVKASNSGEVVLAHDLYFSGKTVIIDHGLGLFTLYLHLSRVRVKTGDKVGKGDIVGEVGATGRVTGPHLHWGVKVFGNSVDPFSLLSLSLD